MDKYEQIGKLAQAAALVQEVLNVCPPEFKIAFEQTVECIADLADQLEETE